MNAKYFRLDEPKMVKCIYHISTRHNWNSVQKKKRKIISILEKKKTNHHTKGDTLRSKLQCYWCQEIA